MLQLKSKVMVWFISNTDTISLPPLQHSTSYPAAVLTQHSQLYKKRKRDISLRAGLFRLTQEDCKRQDRSPVHTVKHRTE